MTAKTPARRSNRKPGPSKPSKAKLHIKAGRANTNAA